MRRAALALAAALAAATAGAGGARAQDEPPDYDLGSEAWNGLSTFAALARGMGLTVEPRAYLSWDELGPGDALVVLYPTHGLEGDDVAAFLASGGRLVIGDDFGAASAALAELNLVRQPGVRIVADRYHDDNQALPVARALAPDHPLAAGIDGLTCNHPAIFTGVDGPTPVFGFGEDEVIVAAGELGPGRFVALADPSVLINQMLELEGNLAFATNLLGHLFDGGAGRVVIVSGGFALSGTPGAALGEQAGLGGWLGRVNRFLVGLSDYYLDADVMRFGGILLAVVAGLIALRVLPARRAAGFDGRWTRVAGHEPPGDAGTLVAALDAPTRGASYALPAAIVRETVNRRLGDALAIADPLARLPSAELRRAIAERAGPAAAQAWDALRPLLHGVPTRAQARSPWQTAPVGRREFDRLAVAADHLYRSLPSEPGAARQEPPS